MFDAIAVYAKTREELFEATRILGQLAVKDSLDGSWISALNRVEVIYNPNAVVVRKTRQNYKPGSHKP